MVVDRERKYREMASRNKYQKLYRRLRDLADTEWRTTFGEIESILGFELPDSARLYRPWWANQDMSNGHSQALAWGVAGWETAEVDMESETLVFRKRKGQKPVRYLDIDEVWPPHPTAVWPEEGLSLSREDLYGDRV